MPTPKLPDAKRQRILDLHKQGVNGDAIAKKARVSVGSVSNVIREAGLKSHKLAKAERNRAAVLKEVQAGGPWLDIGNRAGVSFSRAWQIAKTPKKPEPIEDDSDYSEMPEGEKSNYTDYVVDEPGMWGVLSDVHIPCHDNHTLNLFVDKCKKNNVTGIILNGDILDSHELSDHLKDPSATRYKTEIKLGKHFLGWLRDKFPRARIIFKHGNHEERLTKYLWTRAPAIEGLEGVDLFSWLHFRDFGIDEVMGSRAIMLGKLPVFHGHEHRGGGGVNPARWLMNKVLGSALCGHFHRPDTHTGKDVKQSAVSCWTTGCACDLNPRWLPRNQWWNGFAFVETWNDRSYAVENKWLVNGRLV